MGKKPPTDPRAATRDLAAKIAEAVRNGAEDPLPIRAFFFGGGLDRAYDKAEAEKLVGQLCEEVASLKRDADRLFASLDEAFGLADTPERDQDEEWYARRKALGEVCDEYVGFNGGPDAKPE